MRDIDRRLVAAGWNPISDWWWNVIEQKGDIKNIVVQGGRRGGKSTTLCRIAVSEILNPKHVLSPADTTFFAILSAVSLQAKERIQTCARILDVLGVPHKPLTDQIVLTDRNTGIKAIAATLKAVVSFTCLGALCDEMTRWQDPDTGANPANQVLSSLRPTTLTMPHAQIWYVSAPWSTLDAHYKMYAQGDNESQKVFHGASWEMNPSITERQTRLLEPDEISWRREYKAEPMSSDMTTFFATPFVDAATMTIVSPSSVADRTVAGGDFAFRRNSSAMTVLEQHAKMLKVTACEERIPGVIPLKPSATIAELATIAHAHGADSLACDLHYVETVRETLEDLEEDFDLPLLEFPTSNAAISVVYVRARVLLAQGLFDLSQAPPLLLEQLKETMVQPTENGLSITQKTKGAAHGDLVSSLIAAVWATEQDRPVDNPSRGPRRFQRGAEPQGHGEVNGMPPADWD